MPAELLTPALCLASAQANGLTLQDIPPPLRSLEVCVAALEDQPDLFPQIPTELAVEKGAKSLLLPVSCRRQLFDLSDEMATKLDIEFYQDGRDALLKALAE